MRYTYTPQNNQYASQMRPCKFLRKNPLALCVFSGGNKKFFCVFFFVRRDWNTYCLKRKPCRECIHGNKFCHLRHMRKRISPCTQTHSFKCQPKTFFVYNGNGDLFLKVFRLNIWLSDTFSLFSICCLLKVSRRWVKETQILEVKSGWNSII